MNDEPQVSQSEYRNCDEKLDTEMANLFSSLSQMLDAMRLFIYARCILSASRDRFVDI